MADAGAAGGAPLPAHVCPLCGGPNDCAPAKSGSFATPCWCMSATFDPTALERVPESLRGTACLCRRCATGESSVEPDPAALA